MPPGEVTLWEHRAAPRGASAGGSKRATSTRSHEGVQTGPTMRPGSPAAESTSQGHPVCGQPCPPATPLASHGE